MKNLTLLLLLFTTTLFSQEIFVKKSLDWSMLLNGPRHSYEETSTYNPEFAFGFEFEKWRVQAGIEDHEAINYRKWFIGYDRKVEATLLIENVGDIELIFFGGFEFGGIWRTKYYELQNFPGVEVSDTAHSITAGIHLETQVRITKWLYWSSSFKAFFSESKNISEKKETFRSHVMNGLVFKAGI